MRKFFSGKVNYDNVSYIANRFNVSFHAALSRCIDLSNEDCVVVSSVNYLIKWFISTEYFPFYVRKNRISKLSGAADLVDSNCFTIKTVVEPGYIWFSNAEDQRIEEESFIFPNYNEVISIIHLK